MQAHCWRVLKATAGSTQSMLDMKCMQCYSIVAREINILTICDILFHFAQCFLQYL